MNKAKLKTFAVFTVSVVAALWLIRMVQVHLLPKAPAAVRDAANAVLPKT